MNAQIHVKTLGLHKFILIIRTKFHYKNTILGISHNKLLNRIK